MNATVLLTCSKDLTQLCPRDILVCNCTGTGVALRWTSNHAGVFEPPTGFTFSQDNGVGFNQTKLGFTAIATSVEPGNLMGTLSFSAASVFEGIQVICSSGGENAVNFITASSAGNDSYKSIILIAVNNN